MKEYRVDLKRASDLTNPYSCPTCNRGLEAPEYKCDYCKIELVFYLPTKE